MLALGGCRSPKPTVTPSTFAGFESIVLRNAMAEVVVVPAIGRVMGFGMAGLAGPLWRHPALARGMAADENGWINYGGDKAWPAPQSEWPKVVGKGWPPPKTFDATPFSGSTEGGDVVLVSAVDPSYGIRIRRRITLDPSRPVLTIETVYEKVQGSPISVAVWTIAQLVSPERLFVLLPERSAFPNGHARRMRAEPRDLTLDGRLLSLGRDLTEKTMIASDGEALLWVGAGPSLLIENVTVSDTVAVKWPDGARSQIYTSPTDAEPYVELELLGPLRVLGAGQTATMTVRYTLIPRAGGDPMAEARRIFGAAAAIAPRN
jgi:hypothetical protein